MQRKQCWSKANLKTFFIPQKKGETEIKFIADEWDFSQGNPSPLAQKKIDCPCNRSVPFKFSFLGHRVYGGLIHSVHFFPRSDRYGTEAPEIPGTTVAFGPRAGKNRWSNKYVKARPLFTMRFAAERERDAHTHQRFYYVLYENTRNKK